jgi:Zn-dependent M28 family amino/carboxypeptidase
VPNPSPTKDALSQRLRRHVEQLADEIGERHVLRPKALQAAEHYIGDSLQALGYDVTRQNYEAQGVDCANLEVTIAGGQRGGEIVLAGAHYDTVPGSPGADDNASGVAAILELARLLRDAKPARTTRLVAFVNEEPPFFFWGEMGSKVYARLARARGDDIRVMLSLEMLGCFSDENGSQGYPPLLKYFYPAQGNYIAFVSNIRSRHALRGVFEAFRAGSDFPAQKLAAPALVPGIGWSDQLSFWREGYPAAMVTDTAFHRYRHYHQPTDTPEKLDYTRMAQVVEGLARTLESLASGA